ncbi:unnamed protein product [Musa banksii]
MSTSRRQTPPIIVVTLSAYPRWSSLCPRPRVSLAPTHLQADPLWSPLFQIIASSLSIAALLADSNAWRVNQVFLGNSLDR